MKGIHKLDRKHVKTLDDGSGLTEIPICTRGMMEILFHSGLPFSLLFSSSSESHSLIPRYCREEGRYGSDRSFLAPNRCNCSREDRSCMHGWSDSNDSALHILKYWRDDLFCSSHCSGKLSISVPSSIYSFRV